MINFACTHELVLFFHTLHNIYFIIYFYVLATDLQENTVLDQTSVYSFHTVLFCIKKIAISV
jgi:hypothetical protein